MTPGMAAPRGCDVAVAWASTQDHGRTARANLSRGRLSYTVQSAN